MSCSDTTIAGKYIFVNARRLRSMLDGNRVRDVHQGCHGGEYKRKERAVAMFHFKPCKQTVDTPKITFVDTPNVDIGIQWWGENRDGSLEAQFAFPLRTDVRNVMWSCGHADFFRCVFLGRACDWPNPQAAPEIIRGVGGGNPETIVAYLCNHVLIRECGDLQPLSFVVQVVRLGDPLAGPIAPRPFLNLGILRSDPEAEAYKQRELAEFMSHFTPGTTITFSDGTTVIA